MTPEELAAVWYAAERLEHPFDPIVVLLAITAQRRGEVASIRANDVDLKSGLWSMPAAVAKNGRAHVVHLAPAAVDILRDASDRDRVADYLFGGKTASSGWSRAKRRLDALVEDAVRDPWTLHDLRRSAATGMAALGVPIPVVERVLNQASGTFAGIIGAYSAARILGRAKGSS